jgi:hypothetical protein
MSYTFFTLPTTSFDVRIPPSFLVTLHLNYHYTHLYLSPHSQTHRVNIVMRQLLNFQCKSKHSSQNTNPLDFILRIIPKTKMSHTEHFAGPMKFQAA